MGLQKRSAGSRRPPPLATPGVRGTHCKMNGLAYTTLRHYHYPPVCTHNTHFHIIDDGLKQSTKGATLLVYMVLHDERRMYPTEEINPRRTIPRFQSVRSYDGGTELTRWLGPRHLVRLGNALLGSNTCCTDLSATMDN